MSIHKICFSGKLTLFVLLFVVVEDTLCFCEQAHVVICDDLDDYKINDTTTWRYVEIGSVQYKHGEPDGILDSFFISNFLQTKSLTIIYQLKAIRPLMVSAYGIGSKLEYLNLYSNKIKFIEENTFQNIPNLTEVYLDNNNIEYLGRSIFKQCNLEIVSLQNNLLETITTPFDDAKIKWIRLKGNKLNFIRNRAFPANLERLELDYNLLESMHENVFENLKNLKELSMKHNRLKTLPNIAHLQSVQYLHFSYNSISSITTTFDKLKKLEYIDLANNDIYELQGDIFSSNETTPFVLLLFNRLTNLRFKNPQTETNLGLEGNPWNCDCLEKIEKIRTDYHHSRLCELSYFKNGTSPICIENGKCGEKRMEEEDIDNFIAIMRKIDEKLKNSCNLRYF